MEKVEHTMWIFATTLYLNLFILLASLYKIREGRYNIFLFTFIISLTVALLSMNPVASDFLAESYNLLVIYEAVVFGWLVFIGLYKTFEIKRK